jgi:DNA-binding winged helix-turn-helix (wHTH) protein/Tfp pilus assembly protein PilF
MAAGVRFVFDRFELDTGRRRLTAAGEPVAIPDRHVDVLTLLVAQAGQVVSKDDLVRAGWKDVAVGDNSVEQVISSLRRVIGAHAIETVPRRGYRLGIAVERRAARQSDAALDELLAPHRAFIEGRAALETLERGEIDRARTVFERALAVAPEHPSGHIGLANACVMQFEMTRADPSPDTGALQLAAVHAREACRLDAQSGEAWATLGFALSRTEHAVDALAASKRAVALEPDNWRHHLRLSYVGWGEERLHAAHRTLALLPGLPHAHWLAASVYVARQTLAEAERELAAALAMPPQDASGSSRFHAVAIHWLLGLIQLARGDNAGAMARFERELALERDALLYARECAANTWYAIGALRLREGNVAQATAAFHRAIERVAAHPMAHAGLAAAGKPVEDGAGRLTAADSTPSVGRALAEAAYLAAAGRHEDAARRVDQALAVAAPGSAGWLLPVEPLLHTAARPDVWAAPLARLRSRAA